MKNLINEIQNLNDLPIYLAGHLNPDQDSVSSCLALAIFLNSIGKKAYVLLSKEDKHIINWYPCERLIKHSIDHTHYNFISLDLNENKRLGEFEKYFKNAIYTINIDHHQDNTFESNFTFSDTSSSSTCEIIFQLIDKYNPDYLTIDICTYLYSGILNDTNCFTRRISPNTLNIVQTLINSGINYDYIIKKTYSQRSIYEYKALAKSINEIYYDSFHYIIIDKSLPEYINLENNQILKKIAEDLRKIEDIEILILLIKDQNKITGKCMTNTSDNAHIIAKLFGGGGHKKEAGFTIYNIKAEEIIKKIKTYITKNES